MTLKKLVASYREDGTDSKIIRNINTYYKMKLGKLKPHLVKQILQDKERYMPIVKESLQEESKSARAPLV